MTLGSFEIECHWDAKELSPLYTWEAFVEGYILDHGGYGANWLIDRLDRAIAKSDELGFDRDDLLERRQIIDEVWAAYQNGHLVAEPSV